METDTSFSSFQPEISAIQLQQSTQNVVLQLIVVFLLLIFSALLISSEKAYFSITEPDRQKLKKKRKTDKLVLKNLEIPAKLKTTFTVAGIFVITTATVLLFNILNTLFSFEKFPALILAVQILVIFLILLPFTEFLPKIYATRYKSELVLLMAYPIHLLKIIFTPLVSFIIYTSDFANKKLTQNPDFSADKISQAFHLSPEHELSEEKEILEGVVKLGNKNASEIMKPRMDVVSLDFRTDFSSVVKLIIDSGFSRIPVYSGSFDNIKGILYVKDLLPHSHKGDSFKWQKLIRPPFYVPETQKINLLLKEFQRNKVHLAMVIDEYGGTSGIVTLEDVLEEIVGEIVDEFDEEENFYSRISENKYLFDGKTLLGDFFRITKCDENTLSEVKGDAETLAGLILEMKGEIPSLQEKMEYKHFIFTIEAADNRRIKQIKVEINRDYQDS